MEITELNHIAIYVRDVEKSCDFYQNKLELQALPRPAFNFPGAWFRLGKNQELHLIGNSREELIQHKNNHFALRVRSIKNVEELLRQKDVSFLGPKPRPDGAIQIFLQDPDGYHIELFEFDLRLPS